MFHNIRLPPSLYRFFHLRQVPFGDLPGPVQCALVTRSGTRPRQADLFRPLQTTLSMGWKWAVYIAHYFAKSCLHECFNRFYASSRLLGMLSASPVMWVMNHASSKLDVTSYNVILLHIIDDMNFVFFGWPADAVVAFHFICEQTFRSNFLPIHPRKSSPLGTVETKLMPFIGWQWNLDEAVVRPNPSRLVSVVQDCAALRYESMFSPDEIRRVNGRLVWQSLGFGLCFPFSIELLSSLPVSTHTASPPTLRSFMLLNERHPC